MTGAGARARTGPDAAELYGREAQRAVIDAALVGIATTGASVILRGDPGTGRTALLAAG
ncbi:hypothetical protein [Streptomyces venezuelae]|uniref:hypothetical protein n=1 Tax=Streptomyces venezuelae TaxID=54571 RepID=UPI00364943BD